MNRMLLFVFSLVCLGVFSSVAYAQKNQPMAPSTQKVPGMLTKLSNGMNVLIQKDTRFPLVSLRLFVLVGSVSESPEQAGLSHVLEHMVFKGTENRPKGAVATAVEETGGYLNAATSFDYTMYLTDMIDENWKTGLDVLKDMVFYPTIDPAELTAEKEVVLAELKRGEDSPQNRLFQLSHARSLKNTPYATPIIGFKSTINNLSSDNIHTYMARHYNPQSMLLLVCGNVDENDALLTIEKEFGSLMQGALPQGQETILSSVQPDITAYIEEGPWNKVYLALTIPVPGLTHPDSAKLDVLTKVLGGGTTSQLYQTYKYEKRLVDAISMANYTFEQVGMITLNVVLDADKLEEFWDVFSKDIGRLQNRTFSQVELDRALLNIEDDLFRSQETLSGYASKLGFFNFFGGDDFTEEHYLATLKSIRIADLQELITTYIVPERMATVGLVPKETKVPQGFTSLDAWLNSSFNKEYPARLAPNPLHLGVAHPLWKDYARFDAEEMRQLAEKNRTQHGKEILDLGEGRTLILEPDATLPYAAVSLKFVGGNALRTRAEDGLGNFTASMLQRGTKKLNATAFDEYQEDRAAGFSVSSGQQSFTFSVSTPVQFLPDMFNLLLEVIEEPAFLDEEAARVRENQISAISLTEERPTSFAFTRMFPFLFGSHPYGAVQLGTKETVASFTQDSARTFWQTQLTEPWVLAVCGTFDREAVIAFANKLPKPTAKPIAIQPPVWGEDKELHLTLPEREQAHYFLVFPTTESASEDEVGLSVLQNILAGQSGLLFAELRDKQGLGYSVTAIPWQAQKAGMLIFYIGTSPEQIEQAKAGFVGIINSLHTTLLDAEALKRGKNQMLGDYYRGSQTLMARSSEATTLQTLGFPQDFARQKIEKAKKITAGDLQRLVKKYLILNNAYTVTVVPGE